MAFSGAISRQINPNQRLNTATIRPNAWLLIVRLLESSRIQIIMTRLRLVLLATTALTAMHFASSVSHAQGAPIVVAQAKEELGPDGKPKQPPKAAPPPARPATPPPPPAARPAAAPACCAPIAAARSVASSSRGQAGGPPATTASSSEARDAPTAPSGGSARASHRGAPGGRASNLNASRGRPAARGTPRARRTAWHAAAGRPAARRTTPGHPSGHDATGGRYAQRRTCHATPRPHAA